LKAGEKLPPERDLAQMFDVGRSSIREAMLVLNSIGLVKKTIDGTYVNDEVDSHYMHIMHGPSVDEKYYEKLYEARELIEMAIVELAAQNGDNDDFEMLDSILKEMSNDDVESFSRLDADFHTNIAYASKNEFLAEYINMIGHILRKQVVEYLTRSKNDKEEMEITIEEHRKILGAIKSRDVVNAKAQMNKHLENAKKFFNF
jgi:GntR family transcriptional repressor for pyruvate dehydrogenase complex